MLSRTFCSTFLCCFCAPCWSLRQPGCPLWMAAESRAPYGHRLLVAADYFWSSEDRCRGSQTHTVVVCNTHTGNQVTPTATWSPRHTPKIQPGKLTKSWPVELCSNVMLSSQPAKTILYPINAHCFSFTFSVHPC